jgi:hypothetical protein
MIDLRSENIGKKYTEIIPSYDKLGVNISQALKMLIKEESISILTIYKC